MSYENREAKLSFLFTALSNHPILQCTSIRSQAHMISLLTSKFARLKSIMLEQRGNYVK